MTKEPNDTNVRHGGDLQKAISLYGGDVDQWLDLSTGISPWSYPAPNFDASNWRDLPIDTKELLNVAAKYYRCDDTNIVATPGSQLAIRLIPRLVSDKQAVAVPTIGYQEHAASWQLAGHTIVRYKDRDQLLNLVDKKVVNSAVVINPNNPTCEAYSPEFLEKVAAGLNGLLLIDAAFSDLKIDAISIGKPMSHNIVILKSIGKYFGLAGARVGFVIGLHPIVEKLNTLLSPWSLCGPSIKLATRALSDFEWQAKQANRINTNARRQRKILIKLEQILTRSRQQDQGLFFSIFGRDDELTELQTQLAGQCIWTRLGDSYGDHNQDTSNWLRMSLAGDKLTRLSQAISLILKT